MRIRINGWNAFYNKGFFRTLLKQENSINSTNRLLFRNGRLGATGHDVYNLRVISIINKNKFL